MLKFVNVMLVLALIVQIGFLLLRECRPVVTAEPKIVVEKLVRLQQARKSVLQSKESMAATLRSMQWGAGGGCKEIPLKGGMSFLSCQVTRREGYSGTVGILFNTDGKISRMTVHLRRDL